MSINSVTLEANVCSEPRFTNLPSGGEVMNIQVASNDRRKDRDGNWISVPNFVPVSMFGSNLQFFRDNLHKGTRIFLHGKLHWNEWESKDEQTGEILKKSKLEVVADSISLANR